MITEFQEYQAATKETAIYPAKRALDYCVCGLVGEAGEIANKYKKIIRDNDGIMTSKRADEIFDEIGDVLWYCSQLATELGFNLGDIADYNIHKLKQRKENNTLKGSGDKR